MTSIPPASFAVGNPDDKMRPANADDADEDGDTEDGSDDGWVESRPEEGYVEEIWPDDSASSHPSTSLHSSSSAAHKSVFNYRTLLFFVFCFVYFYIF